MAINLKKGQKINLKKSDGESLNSFCVGANWGVIKSKGFLRKTTIEEVDLDLSLGLFDASSNCVEIIYFGNLSSKGIKHFGDDLVGDTDGDDGLDNETIQVTLNSIPHNIEQMVFILNSYKNQDFATIPFASIRLYEGTPDKVKEVVANYNIAKNSKFSGYVSMVLGKLSKTEGEWKFSAIGEPTKDKKLKESIITVQKKYL